MKHTLALLLCAALILVGLLAGNWQLDRAAQKQAIRERLERSRSLEPIDLGVSSLKAEDAEFRRAHARGTWVAERSILIDNRVRGGVAGYFVVTPLNLGQSAHLLVQRGWVAGTPDRAEPKFATDTGETEVFGELRIPRSEVFELAHTPPVGRVWQNLSLERYREATGLDVMPVILLQTSDADDGLLRAWEAPDLGIDRHRAYALQWFGLALVAGGYLVFAIFRSRSTGRRT